MAQDLRRFARGDPVEARAQTRLERTMRRLWRHRWLAVSASVGILVLIAGLAAALLLVSREKGRTEAALEDARNERRTAEVERSRAERNLERAEQAVERFLARMGGSRLAMVPRMEQVRQALLEDAVAFYGTFLEENGVEPRTRERTADAHMSLGSIRWKLGQPVEAEREFRAAIDLLEALVAEPQAGDRLARRLGHAFKELGGVLKEQGSIGEAEKAWNASLELRERLAAAAPGNPHLRGDCGLVLVNVAALDLERGRHASGRALLVRALAELNAAAEGAPNDGVYRTGIADAQGNLAIAYAGLGELRDAEGSLREALAIRQRLVCDAPEDPVAVERLALSTFALALFLGDRGRVAESAQVFREAAALQEKLAEDFPLVPDYHRELGATLNNLGNLACLSGDLPAARGHLLRAVEEQRAALKLRPEDPRSREFLCNHLAALADVLTRLEALADAEKAYRDLIALREKLSADWPGAERFRMRLGREWSLLGSTLHDAGRPLEAEQAFRRALEIQQELAAGSDDQAGSLSELGETLHELARLCRDRHTFTEARSWIEKALAQDGEALTLAPDNRDLQEAVRSDRVMLAEILVGLGDHGGAAAAVEKSLAIGPGSREDCQRIAQVLTGCARLTASDESVPPDQRAAVKEAYARRAAEFLQRAAGSGEEEGEPVETIAPTVSNEIWRHPAYEGLGDGEEP